MRLHFSYKIIVGALLVIALVLAGGYLVIAYTYRLQDATTKIREQNLESLKAAREMETALFHMRGLTFNYILDKDVRWITALDEQEKQFLFWLGKVTETANTPEEKNLAQQITELFSNYEQDLKTALVMAQKGRYQRANVLLLHASRDLFETIYEKCKAFSAANEIARRLDEARIERINNTIRAFMYALGAGGIVMGGILGWLIAKIILNPIRELVLKVRGAADDEIIEHIQMSPGKELKELEQHIQNLISGIARVQGDLEKNRELLERSNKLSALGKMASGIAHEIRNPLTAIKMLIYAMRSSPENVSEAQQDLEVIIKEIDRIDLFIQDFLKFARPAEPSMTPVNVHEILRETIHLLGPRFRQNNILLAENYQAESPVLSADPHQLKQVIINLLLNAIDAMPSGGRLTIGTRKQTVSETQNGKDILQIYVSDAGKGISEEIKDTLFDPFVKSKEEGVGLGLSISQRIAELHGGWIEAENNPEGGATFIVNLPINGDFRNA